VLRIRLFDPPRHLTAAENITLETTMISVYLLYHHHHHQPINVPTAGAHAFLMDYPQGERAITHRAGPVRIGGC
jgi:hypothetical protein